MAINNRAIDDSYFFVLIQSHDYYDAPLKLSTNIPFSLDKKSYLVLIVGGRAIELKSMSFWKEDENIVKTNEIFYTCHYQRQSFHWDKKLL